MSARRQKVQVKWSGWKRRPRADTQRPVTGRPHVAHSEPRRAWKWFSHSGRPSCSKKLPAEKGAKHSWGRGRGRGRQNLAPDASFEEPNHPALPGPRRPAAPPRGARPRTSPPRTWPRPTAQAPPRCPGPAPSAHPADEAVGVPERAERRDVVVQDGALAALAARGEQLQEVPAAVGAALALVKTWGRDGAGWRNAVRAPQDLRGVKRRGLRKGSPSERAGQREGQGLGRGRAEGHG